MSKAPVIFALLALGCRAEDPIECEDAHESTEQTAPVFRFTPDTIAPGEIVITALVADDDTVDYSAITELVFYGEAVDCSTAARDDELLATIAIPEDAAEGEVNLVIVFEDGETVWVEGALNIAVE